MKNILLRASGNRATVSGLTGTSTMYSAASMILSDIPLPSEVEVFYEFKLTHSTNIAQTLVHVGITTSDESFFTGIEFFSPYWGYNDGVSEKNIQMSLGTKTSPYIGMTIGVAVSIKQNKISFYLDGVKMVEYIPTVILDNLSKNLYALACSGTVHNTVITFEANFGASAFSYPVGCTSFYDAIQEYKLYINNTSVFGINNGALTKLTENWDSITDSEKKTMFLSTNTETASLKELMELSKFKILAYTKSGDRQSFSMVAVPKNQLVLPKGLINTSKFDGIDKVTVVSNKFPTLGSEVSFKNNTICDTIKNSWVGNYVSYDQGKFSGQSAYLNTGYFISPDSDNWSLKGDDFTFSLWVKVKSKINGKLFGQRDNGANFQPLALGISPDGITVSISFNGSGWNITTNIVYNFNLEEWYHIAIVRGKDKFTLYVNGKSIYTYTNASAFADYSYPFTIGGTGVNGDVSVDCYVDDFCLIKGLAVWINDFVVPDAPLLSTLDIPATKIIVTTDLVAYKTYDFTTQSWQDIDHTDLAAIELSGIDTTKLTDIPRAAWDTLTANKAGIGFAYLLGIESTANVCNVDKLQLQVDMKGKWNMLT